MREKNDGADEDRENRGHQDHSGGNVFGDPGPLVVVFFDEINDLFDRRVDHLRHQYQENCDEDCEPLDRGKFEEHSKDDRRCRHENVNSEVLMEEKGVVEAAERMKKRFSQPGKINHGFKIQQASVKFN